MKYAEENSRSEPGSFPNAPNSAGLPFLEYLVTCTDLSPKTIQKHVDNLWALGGEIIRDLNETPSLRKKTIEQILFDVIDDDGGPLIYRAGSLQIES
jgi:hypothetical protein